MDIEIPIPINNIYQGDSKLFLMALIPDNSIDSIVTDPPYGLAFMGKKWDYDIPSKELWEQCFRVLKPGGFLLSFFGSRTYHRGVVEIEDAGFEIRDQIMWVYGSGFPKSLDIGKAIDKKLGVEPTVLGEQWDGWGTALKPAHEPIVVARKPIKGTVAENVMEWGVGGINVDGCRVGTETRTYKGTGAQPNKLDNHGPGDTGIGYTDGSGRDKEFTATGRWPANLIHDGSEEVLDEFAKVGETKSSGGRIGKKASSAVNFFPSSHAHEKGDPGFGDTGTPARFFYTAKASKSERNKGLPEGEKNSHPTVKPLALMRYLVRLVTPPHGLILDPFAGSGTTLLAARDEGFNFLGIELDADYVEIAKQRLKEKNDD